MDEARLAIDVMGLSARGRDASVDRLTALPDQNEIVDRSFAQRSEHILPRLRQGTTDAAERFWYLRPQSVAGALLKAETFVAIRFGGALRHWQIPALDRKSTRLNSSHLGISYAVF